MTAWWLTFTDGSQACCEGQNEYDAKRIAEKLSGKKVSGGEFTDIAAKKLPYPASPCLWQFDHPVYGIMPQFCYSPKSCSGSGSCPKNYACSE